MEKKDIKALYLSELEAEIREMGEKPFRAKQLYQWIHQKLVTDFDEMSNLSKTFREQLKERFTLTALYAADVKISQLDGTRKYLFGLADSNVIESVLMRYHHGNSVCISSQVGCRMGCRFCASTLDGLERNLTAAEMLDQIYRIQAHTGERVSNIVIMGSGEPMDNYDNVVRFIRMISDVNGLNISQRNITVSTCGLVPEIRRFAEEQLQVTLALSLHAPNDEVRKTLMPVAKRFALSDVLAACREYYEKTGRRLTFEYSLVSGVNDNLQEAKALTSLLKDMHGHVNLIPVNPIKERDYVQSSQNAIQEFKHYLETHGINATIRREMGRDINGACGQLRRRYLEANGGVKRMQAYAKTDVGLLRNMNQDFLYSSTEPLGSLDNLFLVADGMGGHNAGDFASRFLVERLVRFFKVEYPDKDIHGILKEGIRKANRELYKEANRKQELRGAGTTLVAATIKDNVLYVANIGDSRLYLLREELEQITKDHSYVEEMVALGKVRRGSKYYMEKRNVITRAVGINAEVDIDLFALKLRAGDIILMCSDGLNNMVDEFEMEYILRAEDGLQQKAESLVEAANRSGGKDNISVILIEPQMSEVSA